MADNVTASQTFTMGPLTKSEFPTWQDFADEIAKSLVGIATPVEGKKGEKGSGALKVEKKITYIAIPSGAAFIDTGIAIEELHVNIINNTDTTVTIGIRALTGSIVRFSGTIPNDNYKLAIIEYVISSTP